MIVQSILKGYKEATASKRRKQEFESLASYPLLYSSGYLEDKFKEANNEFERECILDHLLYHDTHGIDSYDKLENKLTDKYWRD